MKNVPLYRQIVNVFVEQIQSGNRNDGDRLPSESEIVEQFRVSQITAKNALNMLADLGYAERIRGKGTFVRAGHLPRKSFLIGIIFTTLSTTVDKELLDQLEHFAQKEHIRFLFGLSRESIEGENNLIKEYLNSGVDGLIIFPTVSETYNNAIVKLSVDKFPLVLIDRYFDKMAIPSATSNNFDGGFALTKLLLDGGSSRLCFISTTEENSATLDRQHGIEAALTERGLPINKTDWLNLPSDTADENGIQDFLTAKHPDCVITVNAHLSRLTSPSTLKLGICHATYDDPKDCDWYVRQNPQGIANMAIHLLKNAMLGAPPAPHNINVPVEILPGTIANNYKTL